MIFDKNFYDGLSKLDGFKGSGLVEWNEFFETIDKLDEIAETINDKLHETNPKTTRLDTNAINLAKKLDDMKMEVSKLTSSNEEYDAVYGCASYLMEYFNVVE